MGTYADLVPDPQDDDHALRFKTAANTAALVAAGGGGGSGPAMAVSLSDIDSRMPATSPSQNSGAIDSGTLRVVQATQTFTPHFVAIAASTSATIPANALTWSYVLLTGTGTIGGVAAPLTVPVSGGALAATLAYTTGAVSTAFVAYQT